jgi:hypothetical protein
LATFRQIFSRPVGAATCVTALLFLATAVDSAARPLSPEDLKPAPSSSLTKPEALAFGAAWKQADPAKRDYCEVQATGSMTPIFDSRSVLLLERVEAGTLKKNDISIYLRSAGATTCHRVMEVRSDGVLFEGDNNRYSDGWISPDRVQWRVVAIFFTRRENEPKPASPETFVSSQSAGALRTEARSR